MRTEGPEPGAAGLGVAQRHIRKLSKSGYILLDDQLIKEANIQIIADGHDAGYVWCTPADLRQLACGHLFAQEKIKSFRDIAGIESDESSVRVNLSDGAACREPPGSRGPVLNQEQIIGIFKRFQLGGHMFRQTGAAHSCAFIPADAIEQGRKDFPVFMEDVSRESALKKAVGDLLMKDLVPAGMVMAFSGRLALCTVSLACRLGIRMILAAGAPTAQAVDYAQSAEMTLVGFVKDDRMNIYTGADRMLL